MEGERVDRNYEKEYAFLREEIMHHKKRQNDYSTFACTTVVTILGGASIFHVQWISLLCYLIILPCALKAFESRYSIALLSTYMKVYLEPYVGIQWETNLSRYYELTSREWHEKLVYRISKYDYILYSIAAAIFYWMVLYHSVKTDLAEDNPNVSFLSILNVINLPHNWIALFIQVVFIIVIIAFTYGYYDYKRLKETKLRKWKYLQYEQGIRQEKQNEIYIRGYLDGINKNKTETRKHNMRKSNRGK